MKKPRKTEPNKFFGNCHRAFFFSFTILFCFLIAFPSMASNATTQITNGLKSIYNMLAAIVAAIGGIALLWGIFELAMSFQQHDTSRTTEGLKKIVAGLIMCFGGAVVAMLGVTV